MCRSWDRALGPCQLAISSRAARSTGVRGNRRPGRALRAQLLGVGGFAAFSLALSMTSLVSSRNVASVRLRGPLGVLCDSRIS